MLSFWQKNLAANFIPKKFGYQPKNIFSSPGGGGVIIGKNKFALKCSSGKIKCFKTMLLFVLFFNGKPGHRGLAQPA